GEARQREHPIAVASAQRQQPVRAGNVLQVLDDDSAVVDRAAVAQDKAWHLAQRVLLAQRIVVIQRVGRSDRHAPAQSQRLNRHANFAPEWRCRRGTQHEAFSCGHGEPGPAYFSVWTPASTITLAHFFVSLSM